ncbi:MAG: hypothetical protein HYZ53_26605 [Planctomycetes bacterium]|nr:hypothetical protein [Planctomycetota bacterium]
MQRAKDISSTIAMALSVFTILFGGVTGFLSFNELDKKEAAEGGVRKTQDKLKSDYDASVKKTKEVTERYKKLAAPVGWKDQRLDEKTKVKELDTNAHLLADASAFRAICTDLDLALKELQAYAQKHPDALRDLPVGSYAKWDEVKESFRTATGDRLTVKTALAAYEALHKALQAKIDAALKEREDARSQEIKVVGENIGQPNSKEGDQAKMEKDLNQQGDAKRQENEELTKRIRTQMQEKDAEISTLDREIKAKLEKRDQLNADHAKAVAEIEKKINDYKSRIDKIYKREELARASAEFDGHITHVVPEQNYAYIDLGSGQSLLKGTRFHVFGTLKGGKKVEKGEVEVTNVYDSNAQVAILSVANPELPMAAGDYINNEAFDPAKAKTFAFAGRFVGKYSNEDAKNRIEELGGHVVSELSIDTTYLVVGEGYLSHPNYVRATELGVLVIREKDLYELLGIH